MKPKMSASYLAIFSISILMIFFHLIAAGLTGSLSAIGVFYWGYTAWKMHKRENEYLLIFHKTFMWLALVVTIIVCAILVINKSSQDHIGVSFGIMLIFGGLSSLTSFGLMQYFKQLKKVNNVQEISNKKTVVIKEKSNRAEPVLSLAANFTVNENISTLKPVVEFNEKKNENISMDVNMIDDERIWEQAFNEFDSEARRKGLWAKLLVEFNGDHEKAKIKYFKERYEQIRFELITEIEQSKQKEIQAKESERLALIEMTKKLSSEECIIKEFFELKKYNSKSYYIFPNGEAAIKRHNEYRIYANENSVRYAIRVYLESELLPKDGFIRAYKEISNVSEAEIIKSAHVHNEMSNEFIGSREFIFDNEARSVLYSAAQAYIAYGDREALEACRQLNLSLSKGESEKFKYNLNKDEFENLTNIVGMDIVDKSSQERKVEILEEMSSLNKGTLTISQLPSENKWLSAFYSKNIEAAKELLKDSFLKNSSK